MTHTSVHALKAQLSHYLQLVQHGKVVIITSHNKPIAQINPIETHSELGISRMLATGMAKWNGKKPGGAHIKLLKRGKLASELVLEDRA